VQVTINIGIAVDLEQGAADPNSLLRRADTALYQPKHGGRNRVALGEDEGQ
jgi:PleD family two-component response regulator